MNIFEIENLIKKIENEDIQFPRACKPKGYEGIKTCKDKESENEWVKIKRQTIPEYDFELDNTISALVYNIENQVARDNGEFIGSWFYEMLDKYGVKKDELLERVSMRVTGDTNHIFVDGYYAFSFTYGIDWAENGQSYTTWIQPEYFSEMSGGIL